MPSPEQIRAAAESDAKFDGYDSWHQLSSIQRHRYLQRSQAALEAAEAAGALCIQIRPEGERP